MTNEVKVSDVNNGKVLDDGSGAWMEVQTDKGLTKLTFSLDALTKVPVLSLNLLANAKAKDPRASYFSIKTMEVRIGEDRTSTDALIFLVLPGSNTRLAFEIPPGELSRLKSDIEAIERRHSLPVQGRGDN